ncbi:MAG: AAA family ATPase [Methanobacteriaceae archaeon]|nr:AAA family ATPase [Methanobacteriaceae archaeon]
MKVFGVTGMPGSGKGVVSRVAEELGMEVVRMGDVIRKEAKKRNEPLGTVALKLRQEHGKYVVAHRCAEIIRSKDDNSPCLIEGIRSPFEVELFQEEFPGFKVLAVHSTPKTRWKRLKRRMRPDDSPHKNEFILRDKRELKFGIGDVIATADYMVVNEGPRGKLKKLVRSILKNEMQSKGHKPR